MSAAASAATAGVDAPTTKPHGKSTTSGGGVAGRSTHASTSSSAGGAGAGASVCELYAGIT